MKDPVPSKKCNYKKYIEVVIQCILMYQSFLFTNWCTRELF